VGVYPFTIRAPGETDLERIAVMLHACQEHDLDRRDFRLKPV
jgi:hypothetical protein